MGIANVIGLILGFGLLMMAMMLTGVEKIWLFADLASFLIVCGGTAASIMVAYPLATFFKTHVFILISFTAKERNPLSVIEQIVTLSEAARREGLLSLENHLEEISDNPLLATGIRMAVDGMSPEVVDSILSTEIDAVDARHQYAKAMLSKFGQYAPAFGMKGTVIGLILMLADLDPDAIGAGMAVAMITTLYGAVMANLMFLPWADKLSIINDQELQSMEITLKGVIAIQSGENPRIIKQKLLMYLPPNQRPVDEEEA